MTQTEAIAPVEGATTRATATEHGVAWGLTWLSYATYYMGRKSFGVARTALIAAFGNRATYGVETAYLAAYAVGQYVSGAAGDRVGARRIIGFGMLVSAAACAVFGLGSAWIVFLLAYLVNGLAQSTGWPGNIKAMAEWTTPTNRGSVMGVWATCYQVGGIAATALATRTLLAFGWRGSFLVPAIAIGIVALLVLVFLRPGPGAGARARASAAPTEEERAERRREQRRVLRTPALWWYGGSYFCMKLIRYSVLFWLPFYLHDALGYSQKDAGYMSTSFEVGGIAGTIALGLLSDRVRVIGRSAFAALSLVGLAAALFAYARLGQSSMALNFALMALVGAMLFGPDSLLSGAVAQDVGGPRAAAIAAGIINGIGSLGAVLQELVTRGVSGRWGWNALFYVFLALALLGAACLVPTFGAKRPEANA